MENMFKLRPATPKEAGIFYALPPEKDEEQLLQILSGQEPEQGMTGMACNDPPLRPTLK